MLSKCFTPHCFATFRYLRQGRLFRVDFSEAYRKTVSAGGDGTASARGKADSVEYFWLCASCASKLTIEVGEGGEPRLVPLDSGARKPAAAARLRQGLAASAS